MSLTATIADIAPRFPDFRVAVVAADGLALATERPAALDALIAEREEACRARWGASDLSEIPGIAAWRAAYKGFGIRKTSYRSSVERLVKRVKAGDRLPAVNTLVDIYNAVSLTHVFCCGADDLDRIAPPVAFRFSRPGDSFIDMGAEAGEDPNDPPKEGEVVFADTRHVLCRRWNWRQDARTGLAPETRRAVVTVQANGWGDLDAAVADLTTLIGRFAGGTCRVATADAATPTVTL
ncbi:MAG TPA: phenylalanine--tRNA ligase beta subunit-related protein [Microvirga sp.]|jgi:DNA/RNA-binding domain of Phe-tRNA-synthetase-like protein|nr:phenylalanine--tRNA ligase beta subunit-related protein [Microvirga sp.]